jgi:uncharacterized protein YegJ (DUF2314 family)
MKNLLFAAGLLLAACSQQSDPEAAREAAYQKALSAAAGQARAHLAYFWTHEQAPAETEYDFRLKVALPRKDGQPGKAQSWVETVARDGDKLSGQLAAETPELAGVKKGDVVEFSEPQVVDWAFFAGEKLYGHYTTRVMLPKLPPEQADAMRSMFGDNPK